MTSTKSEHELFPLRRASGTAHDEMNPSKALDNILEMDEGQERASSQDSDSNLLLRHPHNTRKRLCKAIAVNAALVLVLASVVLLGAGLLYQLFKFPRLEAGKRHCRPQFDPTMGDSGRAKVEVDRQADHFLAGPQPQLNRQLVAARNSSLLTIMTPIFPDNRTLGLFHNQLRSANMYLNMDSFHEWLLVAPADQVDRLAAFLEDVLELLPCVLPSKIRIVADEVCAPELQPEKLTQIGARYNMNNPLSGWYKQQLIKLACSFTVQTPFYLLTDADTFFLSDMSAFDLMDQRACTIESAVCDMEAKIQFRSRSELQGPVHGERQTGWIVRSAAALQMPPTPVNSRNQGMGVTPQTLSTSVVKHMAYYLEHNVTGEGETWRTYLLDLMYHSMVWTPGNTTDGVWHDKIFENGYTSPVSWTEYDLYFGFSEHLGLWDRYHAHMYLQKEDANLWTREGLPDWKPCASKHKGYWAVVQSALNLKASTIWRRLAPCMDLSSGMATRGIYDDDEGTKPQIENSTNITTGRRLRQ